MVAKKTINLYKAWHNFDPENVVEIEIPDPVPPMRVVGTCGRIDYSSSKWEGNPVYYYHIIRRNPPMFAVDSVGNEFIVGNIDVAGNYRVENGKKVSNGIDDWPRAQPKNQKYRPPPKGRGVTKLGVLEMIEYFGENGKAVTKHYSDRYFTAHPDADWCYISKPHPMAQQDGVGRANPVGGKIKTSRGATKPTFEVHCPICGIMLIHTHAPEYAQEVADKHQRETGHVCQPYRYNPHRANPANTKYATLAFGVSGTDIEPILTDLAQSGAIIVDTSGRERESRVAVQTEDWQGFKHKFMQTPSLRYLKNPNMTAKYPGQCRECGRHINVGDRIFWEPGRGARHIECTTGRPAPRPQARCRLCGATDPQGSMCPMSDEGEGPHQIVTAPVATQSAPGTVRPFSTGFESGPSTPSPPPASRQRMCEFCGAMPVFGRYRKCRACYLEERDYGPQDNPTASGTFSHPLDGVRKHKLMTKDIATCIPRVGATDGLPLHKRMVCTKFFSPYSGGTWYPLEFDGQDQFFGLVIGDGVELGYFGLTELQSAQRGGTPLVEREKYWQPVILGEVDDPKVRDYLRGMGAANPSLSDYGCRNCGASLLHNDPRAVKLGLCYSCWSAQYRRANPAKCDKCGTDRADKYVRRPTGQVWCSRCDRDQPQDVMGWVLECPKCINRIEYSVADLQREMGISAPPFEVECPTCFQSVSSDHIIDEVLKTRDEGWENPRRTAQNAPQSTMSWRGDR
jgi:hypothetical protein